jgi:uncharacterized protein YecT (DUF1311 family)
MKQILLLTIITSFAQFTFGQSNDTKEITPQVLQKIKADIEKQIPALKQKFLKEEFTIDQTEFSLDTFRIEQIVSKRMVIDYTTVGMNNTVDEMTTAYDKLMNKYYNKLLKALKPADKKVLVAAQKAWLGYRDAEAKLIGTMTKEEYSGGGSIQSNIATGSYSEIVVKRAIEIFNYYDGIVKDTK